MNTTTSSNGSRKPAPVLDHSPLLEHIFCDPYPDFSQGAVDAARAYLEAIAESAAAGAAASQSLSAVREPLHAEIRPFAQVWSTVLEAFAPGSAILEAFAPGPEE